jgi:hypothetical protein
MTTADTADEPPLVLELTPSHPGGQEFKLRITPAYEAELVELLREADVYGGELIELAEPVTIMAVLSIAVGAGGALTRLADALLAFIKRHEGKEFTLRTQTEELTAKATLVVTSIG